MDLEIPYKKVQGPEQAYETMAKSLTPQTLAKFQVKVDLSYNKEAQEICADGKGFNLVANFFDDHMGIDLQLGLLLKPLKGKVLGMLEKEFSRVL